MQIREDCVSRGFSLSLSPLSLSLSVSRSRSIVFQSLQSLSNANRTLLHSGVTEEEPSCGPTRDAIYDALAAAPRTPDQRGILLEIVISTICVCVCVCVCVCTARRYAFCQARIIGSRRECDVAYGKTDCENTRSASIMIIYELAATG